MKQPTRFLSNTAAAAMLSCAAPAWADAVTDWNIKTGEMIVAAGLNAQHATRIMAMVQTAAFEAANAITRRYPTTTASISKPEALADASVAPLASVEAAIAAAHRVGLMRLMPLQQPLIDSAYQAALASVAEGPAKSAGIAVGERAAAAVLAQRADDGAASPQAYRPHTTAGSYVPTTLPAVPQWPQRKPWLMSSPAQFRPGPPPDLKSDRWARDYNEVKIVGAKNSTARNAEQTDVARFWETTAPPIYHGLVRNVANLAGRDLTRNARLFAIVTQAVDDAFIAVFDAKYQHNFWRPISAIRNGDIDDNPATDRDASWVPFVDTPMHPEYPCAHCIQAGTISVILQAELGSSPPPVWSTTSSSAKGAKRQWASLDQFVQEVKGARVFGGIHYRFSTDAGTEMGRRIGALAVAKHLEK